MKKRGLGQGLTALLGVDAKYPSEHDSLLEILTTQLKPGRFQPREFFDEDEISSLAQSIQNNGILQPLIVRRMDDNLYEIIAGERRWRAASKLGLRTVPVIIKELTDEEALTIALVENLQRENLNPLEEAAGYQRLIDKSAQSQEEIAGWVGKSRSYVSNVLRLNLLSPYLKQLLNENQLSVGHARALLNTDRCDYWAQIVIKKGLNVRQTEKLIKKLKSDVYIPLDEELQDTSVSVNKAEIAKLNNIKYANELAAFKTFLDEKLEISATVQVIEDERYSIQFIIDDTDHLDRLLTILTSIGT